MHTDRIVPQQWMLVPRVTREHLAHVFGVIKSGITEVHNETVVTDGRTIDDLAVITAPVMAEYVGSEESFGRLWELSVAKAHSELNPPVGMVGAPGAEAPAPATTTAPTAAPAGETPEQKAARVKAARAAGLVKANATRQANKEAKARAQALAAGVDKA